MQTTKEIVTPVAGHKVVIKTMLSGAERESVDTAAMELVQTKDGSAFEVTDMRKVGLAQKHELLRVSVVSIDGDLTDCFGRLQKMGEHDYAYVYEQIVEEQKKMKDSIFPASS